MTPDELKKASYGVGLGNGPWKVTEWDEDLAQQLLPFEPTPEHLHAIVCFRLECEKEERRKTVAYLRNQIANGGWSNQWPRVVLAKVADEVECGAHVDNDAVQARADKNLDKLSPEERYMVEEARSDADYSDWVAMVDRLAPRPAQPSAAEKLVASVCERMGLTGSFDKSFAAGVVHAVLREQEGAGQ